MPFTTFSGDFFRFTFPVVIFAIFLWIFIMGPCRFNYVSNRIIIIIISRAHLYVTRVSNAHEKKKEVKTYYAHVQSTYLIID